MSGASDFDEHAEFGNWGRRMTEKQLQAILDAAYPDMSMVVNEVRLGDGSRGFEIDIQIGTNWHLEKTEGKQHIKPRILRALKDVKQLVECSIEKIENAEEK